MIGIDENYSDNDINYEHDDVSRTDEEDEIDGVNPIANEDYEFDLYNLLACNYHPIQLNQSKLLDEELTKLAEDTTQALINKLFQCPTQPSDVGPVAQLPQEVTKLPREKRVPETKPMTKWEKFAKEKGIKKTKKERMVYDDTEGDFRPRFGYKRVKGGIEDQPIVEVKAGQDPYADPWSAGREEKKKRVNKNLENKLKNELRRNPKKSKQLLQYDPINVPGVPVDVDKRDAKRGKDGIRRALQIVQQSTASLGNFDEMRRNEPARKISGKKRSFTDNFVDNKSEKVTMKAQLRVLDDKAEKRRKGVTNSLAAYEGIIPDAASGSFRAKKGKAKANTNSISPGASSNRSTGGANPRGKSPAGKAKGKAKSPRSGSKNVGKKK